MIPYLKRVESIINIIYWPAYNKCYFWTVLKMDHIIQVPHLKRVKLAHAHTHMLYKWKKCTSRYRKIFNFQNCCSIVHNYAWLCMTLTQRLGCVCAYIYIHLMIYTRCGGIAKWNTYEEVGWFVCIYHIVIFCWMSPFINLYILTFLLNYPYICTGKIIFSYAHVYKLINSKQINDTQTVLAHNRWYDYYDKNSISFYYLQYYLCQRCIHQRYKANRRLLSK